MVPWPLQQLIELLQFGQQFLTPDLCSGSGQLVVLVSGHVLPLVDGLGGSILEAFRIAPDASTDEPLPPPVYPSGP